MFGNTKLKKAIAVFLLFHFTTSIFFPTISYALTSGPGHPEFSSFEPVSTTNMVDEFTGDFTYNLPVIEVPGPQGSSYPLSLSYHSGVTPEEEASWVGYGWTLNPGAINRDVRGIPDDFKGKTISHHNKMPKNWTASVGGGFSFGEIMSKDISLGFSTALRYNNYRGFGYNTQAGITLGRGIVSLGYNVSDGEGSFSLTVSPAGLLSRPAQAHEEVETKKLDGEKKATLPLKGEGADDAQQPPPSFGSAAIGSLYSSYGIARFNTSPKQLIVPEYTGASYSVSVGIEYNAGGVPIGPTSNIFGSYSQQKNVDVNPAVSYGYMYLGNSDATSVMDYHTEKETDFNKRDVFLGIPFGDPDNFMVTGEGIGGGFRLHNKSAGQFGPKAMGSEIRIFNVGLDVSVGNLAGTGADLGIGKHILSIGDWKRNLSSFNSITDNVDEPLFFRFTNDLGGEWGTNHNDKPIQASITTGKNPSIIAGSATMNKNGERTGRSSFIGYSRNVDMLSGVDPSIKSFNKNSVINTQSGRSTAALADLVGELAVFNEGGMRYLYGLPVYNRYETSLSYSIEGGTNIENNYLIYGVKRDDIMKVGDQQDEPYAGTYLLTEINTPDFIDRTQDGATPDDLGGYTRFNYNKHTQSGDWYKWRMPFRGLYYNKNSHSDSKDDMGSATEGEKEIYYLGSVETKTHVAFFRTLTRSDAKEAPFDPIPQNEPAGTQVSMKLDRIELFSLQDCEWDANGLVRDPNGNGSPTLSPGVKPIKTVFFDYDYSQCTNLPNANPGDGKLTLTRVYFEYNGISRARISPYQFSYVYPPYGSYPTKYNSGPNNVTDGYASLVVGDQNPSYSLFQTNAWGNYQKDGQARFSNLQPWVDQTKISNQGGFDPAAWHLKVITLPSGGQIHVQYEQDDYNYVQDQEAHVMLNLAGGPGINGDTQTFNIDATAIGLPNTDNTDLQRMRDMIIKRYVNGGKKIYFKFLYSLINDVVPNWLLQNCNMEFIDGYATVSACIVTGTGIQLTLSNTSGNRLPHAVCVDFVKTQRLGKLDASANCAPGFTESSGQGDKGNAISTVKQLFNMGKGIVLPSNLILCRKIETAHSYFRVPTPLPKKGGGLRVKRLMTFSTDLNGGSVLYGNEYQYQIAENGRTISSGVATNEPMTIREENILTDFIARKGQTLVNRIIAGKDKKQSEGPLGESILPGPSVGYSKVVIRNIHSGETNPGFSISEFFTARDYPVVLAHPDKPSTLTPITSGSPDKKFSIGLLVNTIRDKVWLSQGSSFILNNMHGQVKRKSSYNGPYLDIPLMAKSTLVSSVSYEFFKPGDKVPVMSSLFGDFVMKNPGREVDVTFAQKKVSEFQHDANIEGDLHAGLLFWFLPAFVPTAFPSITVVEGDINTHATSKVVRYPSILKKTTTYQDGVLHEEVNLAFDEFTGRPIAVKSTDEFKGAYLSQSIPASWEYDNFKQKAMSEGRLLSTSGSTFYSGTPDYILAGTSDCSFLTQVTSGDLLAINGTYYYHVLRVDYSTNRIELVRRTGSLPLSNGLITSTTVLSSGRNNKLSENAGAVVFHNTASASLTTTSIAVPDVLRWITTGTNASDGSLFMANLNTAYTNSSTVLAGPYNNMNVSQFAGSWPGGCADDPSNATIRNIQLSFTPSASNVTVSFTQFEVSCGGTFTVVQPPVCQSYIPSGTPSSVGNFKMDKLTGAVAFDRINCPADIPIACIYGPSQGLDNVVSSKATILDDNWSYSYLGSSPPATNPFESGERGKWRPKASYTANVALNQANDKNFNGGTFKYKPFNWKSAEKSGYPGWLLANKVEKYSPNGDPTEERNAIDISSAAKFGYGSSILSGSILIGSIPYLVAQNADYNSVLFESFENKYPGDKFEDGFSEGVGETDGSTSHSGFTSFKITGASTVTVRPFVVSNQIKANGMLGKVWLKGLTGALPSVNVDNTPTPLKVVSRSGEWTLYQAHLLPVTFASYPLASTFELKIQHTGSETIWIDDLRVQPYDAEMTAYVYDRNSLRLLTVFDDQHFGLYYQYSAEGKLIRKIIETEEGTKTIQETHYNMPLVDKNP